MKYIQCYGILLALCTYTMPTYSQKEDHNEVTCVYRKKIKTSPNDPEKKAHYKNPPDIYPDSEDLTKKAWMFCNTPDRLSKYREEYELHEVIVRHIHDNGQTEEKVITHDDVE